MPQHPRQKARAKGRNKEKKQTPKKEEEECN